MNRQEGMSIIRSAVADSLALDVDEVMPESRLITDLGADSLDFIDLLFVLERKFGVKIREGEFNFLSRLDVTSPETLQGEFLTRSAVDKLLPWLPALRTAEDLSKVTPAQLFSMITVETLWIMVEKKLSV
ncbi:MAG: acyl carrier protein [Planctomycetota bacterium]|nr:acyl carrier protein [Planctomycetota bacterium]MDP6503896.1 acyl carrier protein [Planctomycetota bacterium]